VLFDRWRRGPALQDFDLCGNRDWFHNMCGRLDRAKKRLNLQPWAWLIVERKNGDAKHRFSAADPFGELTTKGIFG
jgi:hypothetical protein